jgi:hypothetical protein
MQYPMCEHCAAMEKVLTSLVGPKVTRVIMKRVENELHAPLEVPKPVVLAPQITTDPRPPTVVKPYVV